MKRLTVAGRSARAVTMIATVLAGATLGPAVAWADLSAVPTNMWVTDDAVWSATTGPAGIVYVGGSPGGGFSQVGPRLGGGVSIARSSGEPDPRWPVVTGEVRAVAADGRGGWFIGGAFTRVDGEPVAALAHLRADRTLDPRWHPRLNGHVNALLLRHEALLAGGSFTAVNGHPRRRLVALDARTGALLRWRADADATVDALAVADRTVFVGGRFTRIAGAARRRVAALDASSGRPRRWRAGANRAVRALHVSASRLYIGGFFTRVGGRRRSHVAALTTKHGRLTAWHASVEGRVDALAVARREVFVGGAFDYVDGRVHPLLAALDARTGRLRHWRPTPSPLGAVDVSALALQHGMLYVGGYAETSGSHRYTLFALHAATGRLTGWSPAANGQVDAIAVSRRDVYAGGAFTSVGGVIRNRLAAIDTATGKPTGWDPDCDGCFVDSVAMGDGVVYAVGSLIDVGGAPRHAVVALDAMSGRATTWNPDAGSAGDDLAVSAGTVYVAGSENVAGEYRVFLAAVGAQSGQPLWKRILDPHAEVFALAVAAGRVYVGGDLGQRTHLAAFDALTGRPLIGVAACNDTVSALASQGPTLYVGGYFTAVATQPRRALAALDAATGTLTDWDPHAYGSRPLERLGVAAIAIGSHTAYVGGTFTNIGGRPRPGLAGVDTRTGSATPWNPGPGTDPDVEALAVTPTGLFAGGYFREIAGLPQQGMAFFPGAP